MPETKKMSKTTASLNSLGYSNQFSTKSPQNFFKKMPDSNLHKIRARTSNKEDKRPIHKRKNKKHNINMPLYTKELDDKYNILFDKKDENLWDVMEGMSGSSTGENWRKKEGYSSVLIPLIDKNF